MADRTDLIHRALRNLGFLPQGHTPDAETVESMSDLLDVMLVELEKRDVVYVKDVDNLEAQFLIPLGHCLAWRAAAEFGQHKDVNLLTLALQAEKDLKQLESTRPTYQIAQSTYF